MWGMDVDTLVKLVTLLVIGCIVLIQVLHKVFVKPLSDADERRRTGQAPSKTLRDLLAELRGEEPAAGPPAEAERPESAVRGDEAEAAHRSEERRNEEAVEVNWEAAGRGAPWAPPPLPPRAGTFPGAAPAPFPDLREGLERPGGARPLSETAGSRLGTLSVSIPEDRFEFKGGKIESHVADHFKDKYAAHIAGEIGSSTETVAKKKRMLPGGVGLREAVVAQIILGSPRSRETRGRRPGPQGRAALFPPARVVHQTMPRPGGTAGKP